MKKEMGGYEFSSNEVREMNKYIRKIASTKDIYGIRITIPEDMVVREYSADPKKMIFHLVKLRKEHKTFLIGPVFSEYYKGDTEVKF